MSLLDIFRSRKYKRLIGLAWPMIWTAAEKSAGAGQVGELYLVYVGTLLYATRYQAALAAGMSDPVAKTLAMQVIGQSGYDKVQEDRVLTVFSPAGDNPAAGYAAALNREVARLIGLIEAGGTGPESVEVKSLEGLYAQLGAALGG